MYELLVLDGNVHMVFLKSSYKNRGFQSSLGDCGGSLNVLEVWRTGGFLLRE